MMKQRLSAGAADQVLHDGFSFCELKVFNSQLN